MMYGGTAYYYLNGTEKKRNWKTKILYAAAIAVGMGGYLLIKLIIG